MVLATVKAIDGRVVEVHEEAWEHVTRGHPELADALDEVIETLKHAYVIEADPRPGRQRYYMRLVPSGRLWLRVVTEFAGPRDRLITAFEQDTVPDGRWLR